MSVASDLALAIVVPILRLLFASFSPVLRVKLETFVREFHSTALSTTSPWDDFLSELLAGICGVDVSKVQAVGSGGTSMPAPVKAMLMSASIAVASPSSGITLGPGLTADESAS